jgi:peptidoglycan/xylan/chitin deacetylase (PgdA/CDA1 family)
VGTFTVPFSERGGRIRGCLDVISGRFPAFVLGGSVGALLPVFHFHEVTRADLEPKLRYLADNGYRSVNADEIAAYARGDLRLPAPAVALCFDDAWKSLATVAGPLLKQFALTAIAYVIPARMTEDAAPDSPLATWAELEALHASGVIDVQSHTYSHSKIFCASEPLDFVQPGYGATPYLNRPQLSPPPALEFVTPADLGAPLYPARSRMSEARRVLVPRQVHDQCVDLVAREGGPSFFAADRWRERLRSLARFAAVPMERPEDQERAIEEELAESRSVLNDRLRTRSVKHICLPWGVSSQRTEALLKRVGYQSAFANRLRGMHAVRPGDDPYWLKRLPNRYIPHLPGRGRRYWFGLSSRMTASP